MALWRLVRQGDRRRGWGGKERRVERGADTFFSFLGSVTPQPQPGNPKPRVFRLPASRAIVNRYGFNSAGKDAALVKVSAWRSDHPRALAAAASTPATAPPPPGLLGVNLGKNKTQPDAAADYAAGARAFAPLADFLVVNVSSPNTPGLRALQSRGSLTALLTAAVKARDEACAEAAGGAETSKGGWLEWARGGNRATTPRPLSHTPPLLVKIDADADDAAAADVAAAALAAGVDGVIVSNTTVTRPECVKRDPRDAAAAAETGGLSGPPLRPLATAAVARMYRLLKGRLPIVGVGGVSDGESAYEKIKAGASLVELYTALAYEGPALVPRVKAELAALLARDGYGSVEEAVGVEADKW